RSCTCVFNESGQLDPQFDEEALSILEADEIILAVGQRVEIEAVGAAGVNPRGGRLVADQVTQATDLPGVYAGGDAVSGPATVVAAFAAGRRGAEALGRHLLGGEASRDEAPRTVEKAPVALQSLERIRLDVTPRCRPDALPADERSCAEEDVCTLDGAACANEAERCFNCGCVAVTPSDLAPTLVALDATISTTARDLPAEEFFAVVPKGSTVLAPGELVRHVRLPIRGGEWRSRFIKFRLRQSIDFPILSVATALRVVDGEIRDARIVLGAAAPVPVRARAAEAHLVGHRVDEADLDRVVRAAVEQALDGCRPLASNEYKLSVVRALVPRALPLGASGPGV
ncbi:MAG: FAD binding domain-containing protein, partial [Gaiellaceae bacterium]